MSFTYTENSASVGTTEYSVAAATTVGVPTAQVTQAMVQSIVYVVSMAAGDEFLVQLYEKVISTGSQVVIDSWRLVYPVDKVILPALILHNGWDITVKKISGTDRTVQGSLRMAA